MSDTTPTHTPGRLATDGKEIWAEGIGNEYGYQVAVTAHPLSDFSEGVIAANATRLVQCWNVCEGMEIAEVAAAIGAWRAKEAA